MSDPDDRRALVESALFGCSVLNQINWSGNARTFTVNLVHTLLNYGECAPSRPAIVLLLKEVKAQTGSDKHAQIDALIAQFMEVDETENDQGGNLMDNAQLIAFLVTTGIWARTQLGEIWKLRRQKEAEKPPVELENEAAMQTEAPAELAAAKVNTDRAVELLAKMHRNIADWLDEKEEIDRLVNEGTLDEIRGERRKKSLDEKINKKLKEIPTALARLGVPIDRE